VWISRNSAGKFLKTMKFLSGDQLSFGELEIMFRILINSAAVATFVSIGTFTALAQSAPSKPRTPGAIAAASRLLAEKNESCRLQAKQQGLRFLKRRRFMRECRAAK
jgi:hypothetical protein